MRLNDISKNKYFFKYSIYLFLFSGRPISKFPITTVNKAESQSEGSFHQIGVFLNSLMREAFWLVIKSWACPQSWASALLSHAILNFVQSVSDLIREKTYLGFQLLGDSSLNLFSKLLLSTTTVGKLPPQQFGKRFPNCWGGNFPTVVVLSRSLENRFRDESPSNWNPKYVFSRIRSLTDWTKFRIAWDKRALAQLCGQAQLLITNQNASLIKEFKNTPIWWKEPSDWLSALFTVVIGNLLMGRPENRNK